MPDIVPVNSGMLAVWIRDDTSRNLINRTELMFANYNDGSWSVNESVDDDGTADMFPILTRLTDGNLVCIWQNAKIIMSDTDDFGTFQSNIEISTKIYDTTTNSWSNTITLTDNSVFDRSPKIAGSDPNNMIAVWVSNSANDMWGSATNTNDIMWSKFNSSWTVPSAISTGMGTILDTALAYNGTEGTFVFCIDADDNLDTTQDQELWISEYQSNNWTSPTQLTNDPNNSSPRLIYDNYGHLLMAWTHGNNIRFTIETDIENSIIAISPGESMGIKDFDFIVGENGQIALVWGDTSETNSDIWISYYEPTMNIWSNPLQLTEDEAVERFIAASFDNLGNLLCVYNKTQTEYETREIEIDEQKVNVEVPKAGQSDLMYLAYELSTDLSIVVEDVEISPPNPDPNTFATIIAKVKNLGEPPAENVKVAFYEGDPQIDGVLIDSIQTIIEPIAGGGENTASVNWLVPQTILPKSIYIVVDPNLVQKDRNLNNNSVNLQVLAPDITVSEVAVQKTGFTHMVTARVKNEGTLPCHNFEVSIQDPNNVKIDGRHVFDLLPGTYNDISFTLFNLPFGVIMVSINVDESNIISEFDEANNIRSVRIENYAPADFDKDEDVDIVDLSFLISDWYNTADNLPSDISPLFTGDGTVDLKDFAEFAKYWLLGTTP